MRLREKKLMGGFFELSFPLIQPPKDNLAAHWNLPNDPALRFVNARSALARAAFSMRPLRVWLPAYICSSATDAFKINNIPIAYYAISDELEPDVDQLQEQCIAGEWVLAVNYFGQAPKDRFYDFIKKRNDLIFIEDSVQSIETGKNIWGDFRLISPRKVVGVADGGYLLPASPRAFQFKPFKSTVPHEQVFAHWEAALLRFEDEDLLNNAKWHHANQTREQAMDISDARMSRLSHVLLGYLDKSIIIVKRKRNFKLLYQLLSDIAFLKTPDPLFCPFGFPLRLDPKTRTMLHAELINQGLFSALHWETLPSPPDEFKREHALSKELLTLPCDQRYDDDDMAYLAKTVLTILRKKT